MILTPGHLTKIIVSTFLISVEMRAREKKKFSEEMPEQINVQK